MIAQQHTPRVLHWMQVARIEKHVVHFAPCPEHPTGFSAHRSLVELRLSRDAPPPSPAYVCSEEADDFEAMLAILAKGRHIRAT